MENRVNINLVYSVPTESGSIRVTYLGILGDAGDTQLIRRYGVDILEVRAVLIRLINLLCIA